MRNVHGIEVAGGTFPAQIWNDYMVSAHSGCTPFPKPRHPASFDTFFGDHSASGKAGGSPYDYSAPSYGGSNNSAGGGDYHGYDPRLYASPPQGPPPATPPPTGGVPGGGGGGNPGGGAGGGGPGGGNTP
jgi:hypothetical protein